MQKDITLKTEEHIIQGQITNIKQTKKYPKKKIRTEDGTLIKITDYNNPYYVAEVTIKGEKIYASR